MLITRAITHAIFDLFDLILRDSDSALLDSYGILDFVNDSIKIISMKQCFLDRKST